MLVSRGDLIADVQAGLSLKRSLGLCLYCQRSFCGEDGSVYESEIFLGVSLFGKGPPISAESMVS